LESNWKSLRSKKKTKVTGTFASKIPKMPVKPYSDLWRVQPRLKVKKLLLWLAPVSSNRSTMKTILTKAKKVQSFT
jgi:cytochrome c-type biogenesis protein CcmH/NrfF